MTIDSALTELEELLDGMNYVVSLSWHKSLVIGDASPHENVQQLLGNDARVCEGKEVVSTEMLAEIQRCLNWKGSKGSYPNQDKLQLQRISELKAFVLSYLEQAVSNAATWRFSIRSGHPHGRPIQWSFAFLISRLDGAELFIGSSSD
jgi:hypothetical protein